MHFHRSNRAENLIDALARLMRDGNGGVFAPETVVVQSRGMERWVSMELSRRLGIWANGKFPFPRAWIEQVTSAALGVDNETCTPFAPDSLQWSIAALLPTLKDRPEFSPVALYLHDDTDGRRALDLSREVARVLDQYVVFRPKLVAGWERGEGASDWQAVLWRTLIERHGSDHVATRARSLEQTLRNAPRGSLKLPKRVALFAISTLPPLYVDMLSMLARHIEIHWFLLSPSQEYWVDIRPQREIWNALNDPALASIDSDELHLQVGQPLLASWGRVGKDLLYVIEQRCQNLSSEHDDYVEPGRDTLLRVLQSDMLHLRSRSADPGAEESPLPLSPADKSLAIHACHNEMREVEVLHDQVCALLEADATLTPQDILVMAPDINRYAPLIDAVFSRDDDAHAIAYQISERREAVSRPSLDAFDALLEALNSRMPASTVLDLLGIDAIGNRFGIAATDLDQISEWVVSAGARWGVDEHHRQQVNQPALRENTWRFALDRLLLGYAMDGEGHQLFRGVLPYDDIEGNSSELLGRLASFCHALFGFRDRVAHPLTVPAWGELLRDLMDAMIERTPESTADHRSILRRIEEMVQRAQAAEFSTTLTLATMHQQLREAIERDASSHGFLSSGITFCQMVPMRSIPFRVIALLGMSSDGFPRSDHDAGLDRSKQSRQPGDRSVRDDDRQLLLEVMLSARDHLLITYVGQSIQDNSTRPPSVLVGELLDWCAAAFTLPTTNASDDTATPRERMRKRLTLDHPLQPWSPRYFGGDDNADLFSYSDEFAAGSRALSGARNDSPGLFTAPLASHQRMPTIDLRELEETINDPLRRMLQQRLGIRLGYDATVIEDREPMALDALDNWQIATPLLTLALAGRLPEEADALLRALGTIPLGAPGAAHIDRVWNSVATIASISAPLREQPCPPVSIDVDLGDVRVTGLVRDQYASGTVTSTYSKLDSGQELRAWVRHVALSANAGPGAATATHVVGRSADKSQAPATLTFPPLETTQARDFLRTLVAIAHACMDAPSPFDRKRARAYASAFADSRDHEKSMQSAIRAPGKFGLGAYAELAFDHHDPLDDDKTRMVLAELALNVYGPLLQWRTQT